MTAPRTFSSASLSTDELWFLLNQFGPGTVVGLKNPYPGWLIEEIEDQMRAAINRLLERGMATLTSPETMDVDDTLYGWVQTMAHPEHTLIVTGSPERHIYYGETGLVEHTTLNEGTHNLRAIVGQEELLEILNGPLAQQSQAQGGQPFEIEEDVLMTAGRCAGQGDHAGMQAALDGTNLPEGARTELATALLQPAGNVSFSIICFQNDPERQQVRGFGLLEGGGRLWIMRPQESFGKQIICFEPADAARVRQALFEILP